MYQEHLFDSWNDGIVYFIMIIALPVIPIIIYAVRNNPVDNYLYVLLITTCICMLYAFMHKPGIKYSKFRTIENVVCCSVLAIMLIWAIFTFLLTYPGTISVNNATETIGVTHSLTTVDFIMLSLFIAPITVVIIEFIRCIRFEIKSNDAEQNHTKNIAEGARGV